jgi:predicted AAA+ superfamily ATPase
VLFPDLPEFNMGVQPSYSIQEQDTRHREVNTLVDFNKAFKLKKAVIVTYDEEETIEQNGLTIEVIPVWKWLMA